MRLRRNPADPPSTSNPEAQAIIYLAKNKCIGWRLKGWMHGSNLGECVAQRQRQALRDIAARARATEGRK